MDTQTQQKADQVADRLTAYLKENKEQLATDNPLSDLWTLLQESETLLIDLMNGEDPPTSTPGDIELGPALYMLNTYLPSALLDLLQDIGMPGTTITATDLSNWDAVLKGEGVVYNNGTLISYDTYCQFDQAWYTVAVAHYFELILGLLSVKSPFPNTPATIAISDSTASITIAIAGDWGTGYYTDGNVDCPAQLVMEGIASLGGVDYTIHLGDVYYAGTNNGLIDGEEQNNLVDLWQSGSKGAFTMNSNHEMYDGANGLFDVALGSPGQSLFGEQNGTSFFAITYANFVIIGLDSGYYDTSFFYMDGAIYDANNESGSSEQLDFINTLDLDNKQVIVLTHHIGIEFDGSATNPTLWDQVTSALAQGGSTPRYPDMWYWGHIHNGVAYNSSAPALSGIETPSGNSPLCRCCGHGSLPIGQGYALLENDGSYIPGVDYMAQTPMPNPNSQQGNRVLNGFSTLTLSQGQVIETFYEVQSGADPNPIWTKTSTF